MKTSINGISAMVIREIREIMQVPRASLSEATPLKDQRMLNIERGVTGVRVDEVRWIMEALDRPTRIFYERVEDIVCYLRSTGWTFDADPLEDVLIQALPTIRQRDLPRVIDYVNSPVYRKLRNDNICSLSSGRNSLHSSLHGNVFEYAYAQYMRSHVAIAA